MDTEAPSWCSNYKVAGRVVGREKKKKVFCIQQVKCMTVSWEGGREGWRGEGGK